MTFESTINAGSLFCALWAFAGAVVLVAVIRIGLIVYRATRED